MQHEADKLKQYVQGLVRQHPGWTPHDIRSQMRHHKLKLITLPIIAKWKREAEGGNK